MNRTEEINEYVDRMYSDRIKNGVKNRCFNKYGRPHSEYDDAFQGAVANVYSQLVKNPDLVFHSDGHLATYLLNSITNRIFDITKKKQYKNTVHYEALKTDESVVTDWMAELGEEDATVTQADEDDEAAFQRQRLEKAMAQLRPDHAETIRLNVQGMSYEEAGAVMGLTSPQYKVMLYHARQKMKKLLGGRW